MDFLKQYLLNRRGASRALYVLAAIFFIAGFCTIHSDVPVNEEASIKTMSATIDSAQGQLRASQEALKADKDNSTSNAAWRKQDVEARRQRIAELRNDLDRMENAAALSRKRAGSAAAQYYIFAGAFLLACGYIAGKPVK